MWQSVPLGRIQITLNNIIMAKYLFLFFSICALISMWGMYNVADVTQMCMAMLIMCLMGMAMSASLWEKDIKKKIK